MRPTLSVVELLRRMLERAERGEISGVAMAMTAPDLCTASAWSMESATLAELLGSIAILQHRMLKESEDEDEGR